MTQATKPKLRKQPAPGRWCREIEKDQRLFIYSISDDGRVNMSYRPGDPIAVSATRADFRQFFEVET